MAEGQPEAREDKSRIIWAIVVVILVLLLVYIYLTSGFTGVSDILKRLITYAIIAAVIGLIVWVVLKILAKPKVDLVAQNIKDIIDAGIMSRPPMVKSIYATGDKEHGEFFIGNLIGYCQIQSYKDLDLLANLTDDQLEKLEAEGKIPSELIIKEDCFIFKRLPFPLSFFEQPKVLKTLEHEHSQLVGDVKVYCVSLIKKFDVMYPNRAHLDIIRIDIATIREAWRGLIHQYLKDSVAINQRAVQLDSEYRKDLDMRKMLKLPGMGQAATEEERYRQNRG
jgi:uncharacterized membrane protein (DUF485 family)